MPFLQQHKGLAMSETGNPIHYFTHEVAPGVEWHDIVANHALLPLDKVISLWVLENPDVIYWESGRMEPATVLDMQRVRQLPLGDMGQCIWGDEKGILDWDGELIAEPCKEKARVAMNGWSAGPTELCETHFRMVEATMQDTGLHWALRKMTVAQALHYSAVGMVCGCAD